MEALRGQFEGEGVGKRKVSGRGTARARDRALSRQRDSRFQQQVPCRLCIPAGTALELVHAMPLRWPCDKKNTEPVLAMFPPPPSSLLNLPSLRSILHPPLCLCRRTGPRRGGMRRVFSSRRQTPPTPHPQHPAKRRPSRSPQQCWRTTCDRKLVTRDRMLMTCDKKLVTHNRAVSRA